MPLELESAAFLEGEMIPPLYTCDGEDTSPPLRWTGVPDGTASLAIILEDVDSVKGVWSHWVVFDIPPATRVLAAGLSRAEAFAWGARQGRNDFGQIDYGGPCPTDGKAHRYVLHLYALDGELDLAPGRTRHELLERLDGHVIEEVVLSGRYMRLADR
jgi:Raf kinase inhibitor-like YbhB/YbcL family protein